MVAMVAMVPRETADTLKHANISPYKEYLKCSDVTMDTACLQ